ncbi:MAG: hypothetical protein PHS92_05645 [Candidatus Gracilibacteria bacterium]|nr:hypothetical protein [Candidatus Gracilibacteria bacterium]
MTQIKKLGFATLALTTAVQQSYAAINFKEGAIQDNVKGTDNTADAAIQDVVGNVMLFIGILAVMYGIYGGFLILTAGGKEDGVKKGKTIIFQSIFGIVVIFLANSIVQWLLDKVLVGGTATGG